MQTLEWKKNATPSGNSTLWPVFISMENVQVLGVEFGSVCNGAGPFNQALSQIFQVFWAQVGIFVAFCRFFGRRSGFSFQGFWAIFTAFSRFCSRFWSASPFFLPGFLGQCHFCISDPRLFSSISGLRGQNGVQKGHESAGLVALKHYKIDISEIPENIGSSQAICFQRVIATHNAFKTGGKWLDVF